MSDIWGLQSTQATDPYPLQHSFPIAAPAMALPPHHPAATPPRGPAMRPPGDVSPARHATPAPRPRRRKTQSLGAGSPPYGALGGHAHHQHAHHGHPHHHGHFASPTSAVSSNGTDCSDTSPYHTPPVEKSSLYKTELCRSFEETGHCRYGGKCQFAHGHDELRSVNRHPKYKTEICKTFHTVGTCPYGKRCRFIHTPRPISDSPLISLDKEISNLVEPQQLPELWLSISQTSTPSSSPPNPAYGSGFDEYRRVRSRSYGAPVPDDQPIKRRLPFFENLSGGCEADEDGDVVLPDAM